MTDKDRQLQQPQNQIQQLELKSDQQQEPEAKKKSAPKELKLTWRKGPKAPTRMRRGSSTIIGNTVYIVHNIGSRNVYSFNCNIKQWSTEPTQCPCSDSTLTNIDNKLTTIGGNYPNSSSIQTNKVITYHDHKWVELYSPMPTERRWPVVLSTTTHVVVIGGRSRGDRLNTTEILNIASKQWSIASPLPYGINHANITLCGEILYLMGGYTDSNNASVLSCRLRDLVEQSTPSTQRQPSSSTTTHSKVWHKIPDLPVILSTCVTLQGHVLAIGGEDKQEDFSPVIYRYDEQRNQWSVIENKMIIARAECLATVLPDNNLLVVGGWTDVSGMTDETEISTIV